MSTPNHIRPVSATMPIARLFSTMPNSPSVPRMGCTPLSTVIQQPYAAHHAESPKLRPIPRELTPESKDAALAASIRQSIIEADESFAFDQHMFMQKRRRHETSRKTLNRALDAVNITNPGVNCSSCLEFHSKYFAIVQRCGHAGCRRCHEEYYAKSATQNRSRPRCATCGILGFHGMDVDIEKFDLDDSGGVKCYHCKRIVLNEKMRGSYCCKVVMCSDCVPPADTDSDDGGLTDDEETIEKRLVEKGKGSYRPLILCPSCHEVGPRFWLHLTTGQVRGRGQHVAVPESPWGQVPASVMPHTA